MLRATPRVRARDLFDLLKRPTQRTSDYLSATPADGIPAAHCGPNGKSAFPFKKQLATRYITRRGGGRAK
jgi:hypothetical protein